MALLWQGNGMNMAYNVETYIKNYIKIVEA